LDSLVAVAYFEGRPVAGGLGFRWGDEFEITWASSLIEYKKVAPNMLLYWALMERVAAEGVTLFNFGRCSPGSGTHRFKLQWGTREEQLWWYDVAERTGLATPAPSDG